MVDLHIHTNSSDGLLPPKEVVEKAIKFGLRAIGITDHDTVKGIEPAISFSRGRVEVVPGVELSCLYKGIDVHILGYFIDYKALERELEKFQRAREERAREMVRRLSLEGVKIDIERVMEIAQGGAVGRPHIAQALMEKGYASSMEDAFFRFIGYHSKAYVPKLEISIEQGIELIKRYKGISVIAHPGIYESREIVEYSIGKGIEGIEVWHPEHSSIQIQKYREIAQKRGLLITGGSDSHGGRKGKDFFGRLVIEDEYLEKMKKRRGR